MVAALYVDRLGPYVGRDDVDPWFIDGLRPEQSHDGPLPVAFKICKTCRVPKLVGDDGAFHVHGNGNWRSECRSCRSRDRRDRATPELRRANCARTKAWREANQERAKATKANWAARNRDRIRARFRLRDTGWTAEAFEAAWQRQDGRCAICSVQLVQEWKKPNTVAADHCHRTGKTRELLCSACNRAIGLFDDDPARLRSAAAFLERHR